jgi:hypothetical protein
VKSRTLQDLIGFVKDCEREGVSVAIVDSVTHVWREVCDSALREINASRIAKRWSPVHKLEFQHWGPIKEKWGEWSDLYLNSALHIIICGRAGYEYDFDKDENGKKELVKTGVKMKTEAEFGFEPSLLVEMEREQDVVDGIDRLVNRATVLGDRYDVINGRKGDFPGFDFFKPHVELLVPGAYDPINTENRTALGLDESGADEWRREKEQRVILAEEIKSLLVEKWGAGGAKEKAALLRDCFGTGSWTQVSEKTASNDLRNGLARLRDTLGLVSRGAPPGPADNDMPGWGNTGTGAPEPNPDAPDAEKERVR